VKNQFFWVGAPFGWVISYHCFEGMFGLYIQCYESQMNGYVSSKHQEEMTQPRGATFQRIWYLNSHVVETSNHSFHAVKKIFIPDYYIFLIYYLLLIHD
jgi:hypothetical protein